MRIGKIKMCSLKGLEYRINWEIYTPYAVAAGMILNRNGKVTIMNLNSFKWLFDGKSEFWSFIHVSTDIYILHKHMLLW